MNIMWLMFYYYNYVAVANPSDQHPAGAAHRVERDREELEESQRFPRVSTADTDANQPIVPAGEHNQVDRKEVGTRGQEENQGERGVLEQ